MDAQRTLRIFQKGFNYSQDGRGNRLILHLQGCNMRCPWCSNPEGIPVGGVLMTEKQYLKPECCPKGAVRPTQPARPARPETAGPADGSTELEAAGPISEGASAGRSDQTAPSCRYPGTPGKPAGTEPAMEMTLDREACRTCADRPCVTQMRQKGLRFSATEQTVEEVLAECLNSRPMFFDGGGVTLTGGEVSLQFEAVTDLLGRLGEAGVHRAIETNGTHPREQEWLSLVDEWIMDFKHCDDEKHKAWLGVGTDRIRKNLIYMAEHHPDMLIRIPLMPGFNDSPEEAKGLAAFLGAHAVSGRVRVEVLPYHEFGKAKWSQCGMDYKMKPGKISNETRLNLEEELRRAGLQVVRT